MLPFRLFLFFMLALVVTLPALAQTATLPLEKIKLPPGFKIEVWAEVPNARQLALGKNGTVFAGSMSAGKVYAITEHGDKRDVVTLLSGLNMPVGVAFHQESLYISEVSRILRLDLAEQNLSPPRPPVVVTDRFPKDRSHGWKFIAFSPDGWLYVPVGAPCNICAADQRYALISRIRPDGSNYEVVATGVRNSVGFDFHPQTGALWFTDNGRDWLGDDAPDDELNHLPKTGLNFGFPRCHAGDVADPEFGGKNACKEFVPPAAKLGPHVAPLGMRFYTGKMFPPEYRQQIFIAEHGSWNRSKKIGYRIKVAHLEGDKVVRQEIFAEGWLQGEAAWGRPADVLVMPDGALLVADDHAGVIYRIAYRAP